jgi:serine protease Do
VRVFSRRGAVVAASLALFAMIGVPSQAQPPNPPAAANQAQPPAAPSQPQPQAGPPASTPADPNEGAPAPGRAQPAATPFAELFEQLAARVVGVVVNISTQAAPPAAKTGPEAAPNSPGSTLDEVFRDFFGEKGAPGGPGPRIASLGSGFVIDPSGLIVTNNHVIANADQITVTLSDDTALQAQVVGRDAVTDLALLKVDVKTPLPAASWGDSSKARVGDWVLAIGNPFGLGGTVTAGIISATARDIHSSPYDDYLQTDASINRGNSGGPMFDLSGEVIGINTVIYSPSGGGSIGIGFAIPSALAQPIIEQLKATGKVERGWIGARIQPVTDDIAESVGLDKTRGAMIAAIDPGSPAVQAKLQPGDVILSYDGKPIERSRQLPRLVADTPPDKQVKLTIWRDGKEHEAELKVAVLNPNRPAPAQPTPEKPKVVAIDAFGLKLAKLSPELRKQFALPEAAKGAVITEVPPNSAGASQGLRPGDLVIAVGRAAVTSPDEVTQLAAGARKAGQKRALVRVEREGNTRFVALPIEAG